MEIVNISVPQELIIPQTGITRLFAVGQLQVDLEFCNQNEFTQCHSCKQWFDESYSLGIYHPKYDEKKIRDYCETCFNKKYN